MVRKSDMSENSDLNHSSNLNNKDGADKDLLFRDASPKMPKRNSELKHQTYAHVPCNEIKAENNSKNDI